MIERRFTVDISPDSAAMRAFTRGAAIDNSEVRGILAVSGAKRSTEDG